MELSIEEKAQRYDEALKVLHKYDGANIMFSQSLKEEMFPELKESDDERIRKDIVFYIAAHHKDDGEKARWLYWLEKQGEQKPIDPDTLIQQRVNALADIIAEQKPADKVEPKFKQGEWITNNDYTWQIVNVTDLDYILQSQNGHIVYDTISNVDEQFHTFAIQDAKDGDVLMANAPFIFNGNLEGGIGCPGAHCGINTLGKFQIPENEKHWTGHTTTPATKEQRDLLFQKMKEAGYEWDAEKKELKKIEQKPAWSEEDEDILNTIINHFKIDIECTDEDDTVRWLKSLKYRVLPQQEWSEEDNKKIDELIALCEGRKKLCSSTVPSYKRMDELKEWLKSLKPQNWTKEDKKRYISCLQRLSTGNPEQPETINSKWFKEHVYPQPTWKPSEEQINALNYVVNLMASSERPTENDLYYNILKSLRQQLKKLK